MPSLSHIVRLPVVLFGLAACAGPRAGLAPARGDRLLPPPPAPAAPRLEPAGLTHVLRGMYFLASGRPAAAIPHLRLALVYDSQSAYVHEQLSRAWAATGQRDRSRAVLEAGLDRVPDDPALNHLAGSLARAELDYATAVRYLEVAFGDDSTIAEAAPALVDVLLWLQQPEQARARAHEALDRSPRDADLALGIAGSFEDHGELDAALDAYAAARLRRPSSLTAIFGQLRVLELKGEFGRAADGLVPAFRFYPDHPSLFVRLYGLSKWAGRDDAEAYRTEALRQTEDDPGARCLVAGGDLLLGDRPRGIELLEEAMALHPDAAEPRLYLADLYEQLGEPERCLEVLDTDAESAVAFARARAWCAASLGRFELMQDALTRWARNGADADDVLREAGRILSRAPSEKRAIELLDELKSRLPEDASPQAETLARVTVADSFGEGARALLLMRELVGANPQNPDFALRLADLEARYDQLDSSLARLEALVREEGGDAVRLNAFGYTLAEAGRRLRVAEVMLRRAYRLAEEESFVIDSLGWLMFRRGEYELASRLLERAGRMNPGDPEVLYHLGIVLQHRGDEERAREVLSRALQSHPPTTLRAMIEESLGAAETETGT